MDELIRCPGCRGAKKVPKLGGMIGECNACGGKGTILAVDKPKHIVIQDSVEANVITKAVSECVPASNVASPWTNPQDNTKLLEPKPVEVDVKVDGKKALYRKKKA